jgi:hypothetical protein
VADHPEYKNFQAVWDTGATGSVITKRVVKECGLKPIGMTQVTGVNGTSKSEVFLVNIGLPNKVAVMDVKVTVGKLPTQDVLIGMDIITQGDLAVTNANGITVFSFRIPSVACIDYVKAMNARDPKKKSSVGVGRNDPCPCGSGQKYKKCCGRD